jgi:hypothetical protein
VAAGVPDVSRAERFLVVMGVLCAAGLWVASALPRDAWGAMASTVVGTVLGGGILATLISLSWRWYREDQEKRLLRAFRDESGGNLKVSVPVYKAVARARLQDPSPVLERLLLKRHIAPEYKRRRHVPPEELGTDKDPIDSDYFLFTYEGRQAAREPRLWEFWW